MPVQCACVNLTNIFFGFKAFGLKQPQFLLDFWEVAKFILKREFGWTTRLADSPLHDDLNTGPGIHVVTISAARSQRFTSEA